MILAPIVLTAQGKTYTAHVFDQANNQYNLTAVNLSGGRVFHCRLLDTVFILEFEQVRSLAFNHQAPPPYKGYVLTDMVLTSGRSSRVYVDLENHWFEGVEENFKVGVKIKLTEILRVEFIQETAEPPPS